MFFSMQNVRTLIVPYPSESACLKECLVTQAINFLALQAEGELMPFCAVCRPSSVHNSLEMLLLP